MSLKLLESRIAALEKKCVRPTIPGTTISRTITDSGPAWCIAVGPLSMPKAFFYGQTIEECLSDAEKAFESPVVSGWGDKVSE
jgi:hypothetical protein